MLSSSPLFSGPEVGCCIFHPWNRKKMHHTRHMHQVIVTRPTAAAGRATMSVDENMGENLIRRTCVAVAWRLHGSSELNELKKRVFLLCSCTSHFHWVFFFFSVSSFLFCTIFYRIRGERREFTGPSQRGFLLDISHSLKCGPQQRSGGVTTTTTECVTKKHIKFLITKFWLQSFSPSSSSSFLKL